jgi:hypothetical protein
MLCSLLIAVTTARAVAVDATAVLHGNGEVFRNGSQVAGSSAIFTGDLLETKAGAIGDLTSTGVNIVIPPNSLVEYQGKNISLKHGGLSVSTSQGNIVRIGCINVVPVSHEWTEFEVADSNGTIKIAAWKNNVMLEASIHSEIGEGGSAPQGSILRAGEETTRYESDDCQTVKSKKETGAAPAGSGRLLNSEFARRAGIAMIGGLAAWLALDDDEPGSAAAASPVVP